MLSPEALSIQKFVNLEKLSLHVQQGAPYSAAWEMMDETLEPLSGLKNLKELVRFFPQNGALYT